MDIPEALKPLVKIFQALDGKGQLWSPSGQFLGQLSSNPCESNSILNPQGEYGSPFYEKSIHNPQGLYGGSSGIYSPFNPSCVNPPIVLYQRKPVLVITTNVNAFTNGLKRVDPYIMLGIYEELANATPKKATKPLSVTQAPQTNRTNKDVYNALALA